jgi:hypothetical protein
LIWGNPGGSGNWSGDGAGMERGGDGEGIGREWGGGGQFMSNLGPGWTGSHHTKGGIPSK